MLRKYGPRRVFDLPKSSFVVSMQLSVTLCDFAATDKRTKHQTQTKRIAVISCLCFCKTHLANMLQNRKHCIERATHRCKCFTKEQSIQSREQRIVFISCVQPSATHPHFWTNLQRAWATLSSFGCNLPGPGVIVPKTRQHFRPRNVVLAIGEFSEQ